MGSIEFVGIVNDVFNTELNVDERTEVPENARFIDEKNWIDMSNPVNWLVLSVPIFIIILVIMAFKQKKNGILNKEVREEYRRENKIKGKKKKILFGLKGFFIIFIGFWIAALLVIPIHELLHCIAGALFGLNMKFGIDPQTFIGFAYTRDPMSKTQFLVMSLTPLVILGIIPLIIIFTKYPKEKMKFKRALVYWILTCFFATMIMSCSPDMIQSFNFIKNIPNNAVVVDDYWYIPNEEFAKLKIQTETPTSNDV